jgi:hypothetical protein
MHYKETQYGFEYGAAKVERIFSDEKKGCVTLGIKTPKHKHGLQIYVTKTGKVRIHSDGGEWTAPNAEAAARRVEQPKEQR